LKVALSPIINGCSTSDILQPERIDDLLSAGVSALVVTAFEGSTKAEGYYPALAMSDTISLKKVIAGDNRLVLLGNRGPSTAQPHSLESRPDGHSPNVR